jgi:hypothetical protein
MITLSTTSIPPYYALLPTLLCSLTTTANFQAPSLLYANTPLSCGTKAALASDTRRSARTSTDALGGTLGDALGDAAQ